MDVKVLKQMVLRKAKMLSLGKNEMVAQCNAEQLSGGRKLLRAGDITLTWLRVTRGMVMGNDNAGSSVGDGVSKHFTRVCLHAVEQSDGDRPAGNQSLSTIQT